MKYTPEKFTVEQETFDLLKNSSSFLISLDCTDFNFIKKPRLFVRADGSALFRINLYRYYPVKIKKEHIRQIRKVKAIDLCLHRSNGMEDETRPLPVSQVLNFPECCKLYMNQKPEEKENPGNLSELLTDVMPPPPLETETASAALEKWLEEHPEYSMTRVDFEFEDSDIPFCWITDYKSKAFLVCLFEQGDKWTADEDNFDGDIPRYYSHNKEYVSPVFALTAVSDYLWCRTGLTVPKCVLLGDETVIKDLSEIEDTWESMHIPICFCEKRRESSFIVPFTAFADKLLGTEFPCLQAEIAALTRHFNDLQEYSFEKICQNHMRMYFLQRHFQDKEYCNPEAAIVETWLEHGTSGNILLGRFFYAGYFFNLIYNFRNVAIVLENASDMRDPAEAVIEIHNKLRAGGTPAALTPCIVSQKKVSNTTPEYINIYDDEQLFRIEKFTFVRETEFDWEEPISKDDVRSLVAFAGDLFGQKRIAEKCNDSVIINVLQRLEKAWSDKNILFLYDTQRFANPVLALYMHNRNSTSVIIIKCFTGSNLSEIKNLLAEEHTHNASLFETNRLKTVVLADNIQENRANYIEIDNVFYTRFNDFMPLICQLLMTF